MALRCGTARRSAVGSFESTVTRIRLLARQWTSWNECRKPCVGWGHFRQCSPRRHSRTCGERASETRACCWVSTRTWPCRTGWTMQCHCRWCRACSSCGLSSSTHWSIRSTTCDTPCTGAFHNAWWSRRPANPWHIPMETGVFGTSALTWRQNAWPPACHRRCRQTQQRQQHPRQRPCSQQDHRCSTLYFVAPLASQRKIVANSVDLTNA